MEPSRHRRPAVLAAAIVVCLLAAGSALSRAQPSGGIPGCAPLCLSPGITTPGDLPAGKYTTKFFFAHRMTLSLAKGWSSGEDSTGEFKVGPKAAPDSLVLFWEDVYAVTPSNPIGFWRRVGPLRRTSASLLAWLRKNRNLTISKSVSGRIGSVRARVVDVSVSARAVNDDPGCPAAACANFLQFPQWDGPYGIAGTSVTRLYLADVRYGGQQHLFVAAIEGVTRAGLDSFLPAAEKLIATVRVPVS
jgi:hypothetical protein